MDKLNDILKKAQHSSFYLWLLNFILLKTVKFNKPHHLKLLNIKDEEITIGAPYRRVNHNHIKGMHACLLATLCEYVSGLSLLTHLSPKEYRIILKNIRMTYHFQAKTDVQVTFKLTKEDVMNYVLIPLKKDKAIFHEFKVDVYDKEKNHICTGLINWQIKEWSNVKMKI